MKLGTRLRLSICLLFACGYMVGVTSEGLPLWIRLAEMAFLVPVIYFMTGTWRNR